jgi:hypothetical protein
MIDQMLGHFEILEELGRAHFALDRESSDSLTKQYVLDDHEFGPAGWSP